MYDIIVVGGGHAGCEAAYAASYKGYKTALITSNIKNIADMPCNPSIGGTAKGIVVREIDALGGIMGKVADYSHFQIKMLNSSKGPAVRSLRAQADKVIYPKIMLETLKKQKNLDIIEGMVEDLIVEKKNVQGVVLENGEKIVSKIVILTTGTYLNSSILVGYEKTKGAPHGEREAKYLSKRLAELGFEIQILKTGTPQRIKNDSIDFTKLKEEKGDNEFYTFSFDLEPQYELGKQRSCYLTYTNETTHQIIRDNLDKSAMYSGLVEGVGARYCPSIEDKIVRFADKERHQLFLEPESNHYDDWYLQGFSTSMPKDVQEKMVHSLVGLENAKISKYAYAIEYDAINPLQLKPSLETKILENLFTAGQINGTSGYEEAAAQGLIAGINATLKLENKEPLVLKRNEAYIGVLIDDLVTRGTSEPYRLLTSRAEFRLILRSDNADLRLREHGYNVGLIDTEKYGKLIDKREQINSLMTELKTIKLDRSIISSENISNKTVFELLKRPEITFEYLKNNLAYAPKYNQEIINQVEIEIKYEGYISKTYKEVARMLNLENKKIPEDIDYEKVGNLATEARQKLLKIKPKSLGQASRISGVNPVDISVLSVYLKKEYPNL